MAFKYDCHPSVFVPCNLVKPFGISQSRFSFSQRAFSSKTSLLRSYNPHVSLTRLNFFWKQNLTRCFSCTKNTLQNTNPIAKYLPNRKKTPAPVMKDVKSQPQIDLKTIRNPEDLEALPSHLKKKFIEKMIKWNFKPDLDIYIPLMQAFFRLNDYDYVFDIFELLKERRMHKNETVYNLLISAYGKNGDIRMMAKFLHEMEQEGITATVESYNNLLSAFMERKDLDSSLKYFDQMKSMHVHPNQETFSILIHTAYILNNFSFMTSFFAQMETEGFSPGLTVFNQMMEACSLNGDLRLMSHYFRCMLDAGIEPTSVTFYTLGRALRNHGDINDLPTFMDLVMQHNMKITEDVFKTVLNQFAGTGDVLKVKSLLQDAEKYGLNKYRFPSFFWAFKVSTNPAVTFNINSTPTEIIKKRIVPQVWQAQLKQAAAVGINRILSVLDTIKTSGKPVTIDMINYVMGHITDIYTLEQLVILVPDMQLKWNTDTYNNLLCGYAKNGDLPSVKALMQDMQTNNIKITMDGYAELIKAYGAIKDYRSVRWVFYSLLDDGYKPDATIYASLFAAFNGRVLQLRNYFNMMVSHGIKPTHTIIRDLASCLANGDRLHCITFFVNQSVKYGYKLDYTTSLFIFQLFLKSGVKRSLIWFHRYLDQGILPIEPMWALVMQNHLVHRQPDLCLETFSEMKRLNVPVTQLTVDLIALLHTRKYRWSQFGANKATPGYWFRQKVASSEHPETAPQT